MFFDSKICVFFQVSPQLYGDNHTRLFTYWTVSFYLFMCFSLFLCVFLFIEESMFCLPCEKNRVMPTKEQAVTIFCAQDLFKSIGRLQWVDQSLLYLAMETLNMTLSFLSGR